MSTFELAKSRTIRDMQSREVHTAESWTAILLQNTSRLANEEEQAKYWAWILNPTEDEDVPKPELAPMTHSENIPQNYTVKVLSTLGVEEEEEKNEQVNLQMTNKVHRNGLASYILTKPKTDSEMLPKLPESLGLLQLETDEKTASET